MPRLYKLRGVDLWVDHNGPSPAVQFLSECSPIDTLYTLGLRQASPPMMTAGGLMRILVDSSFGTELTFPAKMSHGPNELMFARVRPDDDILNAAAANKPLLYLEWINGALHRLAEVRKWNPEPLQSAYDYCIARDLVAHFESKPLYSGDRRHFATLSLTIENNGDRVLVLDVSDRTRTSVATAAATMPAAGFSLHSWNQFKRKLHWTSDSVVEIELYRDVIFKIAPQMRVDLSTVS